MSLHLSLPSLNKEATAKAKPQRATPPIVLAMLAQAAGAGVTLFLLWLLPVPDRWGELSAALCHGLVAAVAGRMLGLAPWWIPINVGFVPVALVATGSELSPEWFLSGFVALGLVYWSSYRTQVPLYLTSSAGCRVVAEILEREKGSSFLDIGSGSGSVLAHVARRFPGVACEGVELAPLPYWISRLRFTMSKNCRVNWKDFWSLDLSRYDVVYAFLSPVPMSALWEKVRREMRPGTLFISNSFPVVGVAPKEILVVPGPIKRKLYLWRI
ncbi:MAG: class I SAM-dependent methyltransferase [Burkholderiales bacterium]